MTDSYLALDERIAKTWANQELLLLVLDHPDLPLHNNDMELAARRRVRKRDVSFGPQSRAGVQAWDTFQTIIATATKLGVRVYAYFLGRLMAPTTTPTLADHIRERTRPAACPHPTRPGIMGMIHFHSLNGAKIRKLTIARYFIYTASIGHMRVSRTG